MIILGKKLLVSTSALCLFIGIHVEYFFDFFDNLFSPRSDGYLLYRTVIGTTP